MAAPRKRRRSRRRRSMMRRRPARWRRRPPSCAQCAHVVLPWPPWPNPSAGVCWPCRRQSLPAIPFHTTMAIRPHVASMHDPCRPLLGRVATCHHTARTPRTGAAADLLRHPRRRGNADAGMSQPHGVRSTAAVPSTLVASAFDFLLSMPPIGRAGGAGVTIVRQPCGGLSGSRCKSRLGAARPPRVAAARGGSCATGTIATGRRLKRSCRIVLGGDTSTVAPDGSNRRRPRRATGTDRSSDIVEVGIPAAAR
mmetsp:Transcript_95967/g.271493  ORF Transcript_95967/g.271493 Transcript_95967/m.271493 type:complete len:253 (-) Transcript_95967:638-1396(-)